jgi:nitrite reductase/ring-hydroxylating ferredoxin subunit
MSDQPIEYHKVAKTTDIDEGEATQVLVGRREIAIYNLDGNFFATDDICTHAYASLADGYIEDDVIECPLHGGSFEIRTGKAASAPCTEDLKTYPVKIEGDAILVGVPKDN